MAFLGGISGIWAHEFADEHIWRNPMQDSAYASISPSEAAASPQDAYAWKYINNTGGAWLNTWRQPASDAVTWYCWHMNQTYRDAINDAYYFFYAHYDPDSWGGGPVTGAIGVRMNEEAGNDYMLDVVQHNGFAWERVGIVPSGTCSKETDYYVTLELDRSGGDGIDAHTVSLWIGDDTDMMNAGDPYLDAVTPPVDIVLTGTPCIYNKEAIGGKGVGETNDVTVAEVFAYDDDNTDSAAPSSRQEYYGAATQPHVFSIMPVGDSPVGGEDEWSITGNPAGCPNDAWRAVDDYFDDDDQANDRIHSTGDESTIDQLFDMAEDWHDGTPVVYGVMGALACYQITDDRLPSHGLMYCVGDGAGTPVEYTLTGTGGWHLTGVFDPAHIPPVSLGSSAPWTHDLLDSLRAGVRNDSDSHEERCNIFLVHVLGTNLQMPSNNSACPAVATMRRRGLVV